MDSNGGAQPVQEEDFNKQMLYIFDTEEIKFRLRLQLFGNMSLLVELFIQKQIPDSIIKTCIDSLIDDIDNDQSTEILCQMLHKICQHTVQRAIRESQATKEEKGRSTLGQSLCNSARLIQISQSSASRSCSPVAAAKNSLQGSVSRFRTSLMNIRKNGKVLYTGRGAWLTPRVSSISTCPRRQQ